MKKQQSQLFRKEAIECLSSPERLDQMVRVVGTRAWLSLTAIGFLVISVSLWSALGRIPVTAEGKGILLRPRRVVQIQSPSSGLLMLRVRPGDRVKKGDVIGTVDRSELRQQQQQEEAKLTELLRHDRATNNLQQQASNLERLALAQKQAALEIDLHNVEALLPYLRNRGFLAIEKNRLRLVQQLQQLKRLLPRLEERLEVRRRLFEQRAIPKDLILQSQQDYITSLAQVSNLEVQLKQQDFQTAQAQLEYVQNLNRINNIKSQIKEIDARQIRLVQQELDKSNERTERIRETKRRIAQLELKLNNQSNIVSHYNGRILEIGIVPGRMVDAGTRLGVIEIEDTSAKMVSLAYFADRDGKQIKLGMAMEITPSVVKRERFGGIVAKVTEVSSFPVTTEDMAAIIGNEDVAQSLAQSLSQEGGIAIQIYAQLEENRANTSGYKWSSSKGPNLKLSPGTTTSVRVKIGERTPISYVIPILRSWTGVY